MKKITMLALFILMMNVPLSDALTISIAPIDHGSQLAADDTAESNYVVGRWFMVDAFVVNSDVGFYGPAFAVYDLSHFTVPVSHAVLSFDIRRVSAGIDTIVSLPMRLYDLTDIDALQEPSSWPPMDEYMASFFNVKADMLSGAVYGNFALPNLAENFLHEVILSESALYDINASLGGLFAVAIGPGERTNGDFFPDEGAAVYFETAQLVVTPVPEPATIFLIGLGFVGSANLFRRKAESNLK